MLSIIVPTLNEEKYLPKLLESIKKQDFKDYEIIVADNNSKDKTVQIAKKYGCRIVKGGLPAAARNNGAKVSKGKYLLFLDADTILEKNGLGKVIEEINERKLDIAAGLIIPLDGNIIDNIYFAIYNLWAAVMQYFYPHATGSFIFVKKRMHNKIKGFDESITLAEDHDYVRRCAKYGKFRLLKSMKLYTSMRRFKAEGRLKIGLKILIAGFYRIFFGEIKTDFFKYNFNYKK